MKCIIKIVGSSQLVALEAGEKKTVTFEIGI